MKKTLQLLVSQRNSTKIFLSLDLVYKTADLCAAPSNKTSNLMSEIFFMRRIYIQ